MTLSIELRDSVAWIKMTLPERRNPLTVDFPNHMLGILDRLEDDASCRWRELDHVERLGACHAVPAALSWLKRDDRARLITLIKPHYEVEHSLGQKGVLDDETASTVAQRVIDAMPTLGVHVLNQMPSPIRGGGGKGRGGQAVRRSRRSAA